MAQSNGTIESQETAQLGVRRMVIDISQQGNVCVLRCQGSFLAGLDADYVYAKIEDIKQLKCSRVLADFQDVPAIGSTGIAFLVGVYSAVARISGGRFVLTGASPLVRRVLDITKLSTVIPLAPDFSAGLAALGA
jgi:anti-anti-sigma factor